MSSLSGFLRPLIALGIGAASFVAGAIIAFRLFTPAKVPGLLTGELFALLGLILLPLATFALAVHCWRLSQRALASHG